MRAGGVGARRGCRSRWHRSLMAMPLSGRRATTSRSPARSSTRPPRSTRPKTSSLASGAVMSCRRRCRRVSAANVGCVTRGRLDQPRGDEAKPIPCSRAKRLLEARRRLEEELDVQRRANAAYATYRARGVMKDGRRFGRRPSPISRLTCRRASQPDRSRFAQPQDAARLSAGVTTPRPSAPKSDLGRG
jgi:hypothetical protein